MKEAPLFAIAGVLWGLAFAMLVGCSDAYLMSQLKCVDQYDTKAQIDACRNAVKADAGRLGKDAGHE